MTRNINPIPLIAVLFLLKSAGSAKGSRLHPPVLNTLELESILDNAHSLLHTIEKINGFTQAGGLSSLPDMKKVMEIVEKLPL